jgi:hypothetical protein
MPEGARNGFRRRNVLWGFLGPAAVLVPILLLAAALKSTPQGSYRKYRDDGLFVVGRSDTKQDWPYVQPGPSDSWAGSRLHVFTILFSMKAVPAGGDCGLLVALVDTQSGSPPQVEVTVNGSSFRQKPPPGAGDASISGRPGRGTPQRISIKFPSSLLHAGQNEIRIRTIAGSWILYDSIGLETPVGAELSAAPATVLADVKALSAIQEKSGRLEQPVHVAVRHFGAPAQARILANGTALAQATLKEGNNVFEAAVPAVDRDTELKISLEMGGSSLASRAFTLKPVRRLTVYILPHSHTDIGYTEIQTEIEDKQVNNLLRGIAYARQTASNPPGERFVWNVEVLWAADLYLRRLNEAQRQEFMQALKQGQIALNGMYLNELTGLCRQEELIRLFRYGTRL